MRNADVGSASRKLQAASRNTPSSDDPRHFEEAGIQSGVGGGSKRVIAIERAANLIRPIGRMAGKHGGSRRDAGGVDLLHDFGVREDVAELAREEINLRRVELEVRQRGNGRDLVSRKSRRHAKC